MTWLPKLLESEESIFIQGVENKLFLIFMPFLLLITKCFCLQTIII